MDREGLVEKAKQIKGVSETHLAVAAAADPERLAKALMAILFVDYDLEATLHVLDDGTEHGSQSLLITITHPTKAGSCAVLLYPGHPEQVDMGALLMRAFV